MILDLVTQIPHDVDQLDVVRIGQSGKRVQNVVQDGFASYAHQLLGFTPGVWP
jgi:hypothetical protein